MINSRMVIFLSVSTALIGLLASFFISFTALAVTIVFWTIGFLYNWKLKRTGLLGNHDTFNGFYNYFSTFKLLKSPIIDEKRKYARFIYLGATLGLVAFIIGQIL